VPNAAFAAASDRRRRCIALGKQRDLLAPPA
jgi:hypothetical protein